ncbi:MAG: signal peptidase II [Candidatus Omnitrophica bacterium]|nr:signal peptidase II [Candidatus Omnitrophota bacterium]
MRKSIILTSVGILLVVIDQTIKIFLARFLKPAETISIIKNIFHITLVFNTGCAFGLFKRQSSLIFVIISFFAIIFLIYFVKRVHRGDVTLIRLAGILIISGSISNLIDRFRVGYVIDFLDFRIWPVFNLGDTAIAIGVLIFILQSFFKV